MLDQERSRMEPEFIGLEDDCHAILDVVERDVRAFLAKDLEGLAANYIHENRLVSLM